MTRSRNQRQHVQLDGPPGECDANQNTLQGLERLRSRWQTNYNSSCTYRRGEHHGNTKDTQIEWSEGNREERSQSFHQARPKNRQECCIKIKLGWPPRWCRTPGGLGYGAISRFAAQSDRCHAFRQGVAGAKEPRQGKEPAARDRRLRHGQTKAPSQELISRF